MLANTQASHDGETYAADEAELAPSRRQKLSTQSAW